MSLSTYLRDLPAVRPMLANWRTRATRTVVPAMSAMAAQAATRMPHLPAKPTPPRAGSKPTQHRRPKRHHRAHWGRRLLWGAVGVGAGIIWQQRRRRPGIDLTDQVVVIAGASRGLGLALAEEFALHGAKLALCAREPGKLEDARRRVAGLGAEAFAMPCDLTDRVQVQQFVDATRAHFGRIDILVNNASTIMVAPALNQSIADLHAEMDNNFWSTVNITYAVLPFMRQRGHGRIVNITSVGGKVSVPHLLSYSTAKFAAVGFSEGLRAELAQDNIIVTTIAPGLMRTGSPPNAYTKGQHAAEYTWFKLLDALPFTSISAADAAKQIVRATQRGDAEVVLSWQAQILTVLHGLVPGFTADLLGLVNRVLPKPSRAPQAQVWTPGSQSETAVSKSFLTGLGQEAETRYQER